MSEPLSRPILVLSPHLDDAVLSCGGLLIQHEDALVATAFSADPPTPRTGPLANLASPEVRREEDHRAMTLVGAEFRLLGRPDAIDRVGEGNKPLYPEFASIFGVVHPEDAPLCTDITNEIALLAGDRLILCPMAVGAHVDHQLCAHAGRKLLAAGHDVLFYEDAPYVYPDTGGAVQGDSVMRAAARMRARVRGIHDVPIDDIAKSKAVACYASQVSDLFGDLSGFQRAMRSHFEALEGEIERLHFLQF